MLKIIAIVVVVLIAVVLIYAATKPDIVISTRGVRPAVFFIEDSACSGFDASPPQPTAPNAPPEFAIMVKKGASNSARAIINPVFALEHVFLDPVEPTDINITPRQTSQTSERITVSHISTKVLPEFSIGLKPVGGARPVAVLTVSVKPRRKSDTGNFTVALRTIKEALNPGLDPQGTITPSVLAQHLNDVTWGRQANTHFSVTALEHSINYDLDGDGLLKDPTSGDEELITLRDAINATAHPYTNFDVNIHLVKSMKNGTLRPAFAFGDQPDGKIYIQDSHPGSKRYALAHELGHILRKDAGDTPDQHSENNGELMVIPLRDDDPCRLRKEDWNKANLVEPPL